MAPGEPPSGDIGVVTSQSAVSKPSGETTRWLECNDGKEDTASKEQSRSSAGTRSTREPGGHPWDAFFNAPEQREDDRDNADDRPGDERSAHNPRVWCDRRGRVEWRPGAGKCPLDDERISHCLGRILRYHTERFGLKTDSDGYVSLTSLLAEVQDFEGVSEADIRRVVQTSTGPRGPRFEIREAAEEGEGPSEPDIRALYKHPQDARPRRPFGDDRFPGGFYGRSGGFGRGRSYGVPPPWFGDPAVYGRGGRQPFFRHPAPFYGGPRQRLGFSQPPPDYDLDDEEGQEGDAVPRQREAAAGSKQESAGRAGEAQRPRQNGAAEDGLTAHAAKAGAEGLATGSRVETSAPEMGAEPSSASASTTASTPKLEVWERYHEPESKRAWFWNESTEEVFYADDEESGWERFLDAQSKPWWWHQATGRYFYEEEEEEDEA